MIRSQIIQGDCLDVLPTLEAQSVHCCVTSPPYWGLRDYGTAAWEGGDAECDHIHQKGGRNPETAGKQLSNAGTIQTQYAAVCAKCGARRIDSQLGLEATPEEYVWSKANPMPESVTDRPTKAHEYVFLLSKRSTYFYDADAIREPQVDPARGNGSHESALPHTRSGFVEGTTWVPATRQYNPAGRNKRTVWEIATQPFPGAHFATFPEALVKPCILAGTSERGVCPECGAPWERVVKAEGGTIGRSWNDHQDDASLGQRAENMAKGGAGYRRVDLGWRPACQHKGEPVPATILDPFAGSGTVGVVARLAGRRAVLIELSEDYCAMMRDRMAQAVLL